MTTRRLVLAAVTSVLFLLAKTPALYSSPPESLTPEEVFARAAKAYREPPALEDTLTMVIEIPGEEPGERIVRYRLGRGSDIELDIQGYMRLVTLDERLYAERFGHEGEYLETAFDGDLAGTLAEIWDDTLVQGIVFRPAGLWEPPQLAMRVGKELDGVLEALRFTPVLEELSIADDGALPNSNHEVRLEAANGRAIVRFDPETFFLSEVEYEFHPAGAPKGYEIRARGHYAPRRLTTADGVVGFAPGDRHVVSTLRELRSPPPGISVPPAEVLSPAFIEEHLLSLENLAREIRGRRVLLIGEDHLFNETVEYAKELLQALDDRPLSLLLELPAATQPAIDAYLENCSESALESVFAGRPTLTLQELLRWACAHPQRVRRVSAMDEDLLEILLKRLFLADTRNQTMATAILEEYQSHPERRVVAYAGQLHMTRAGRYRYNQPDREPAGARLLRLGVPEDEMVGIMLNGGDKFHLHEVWESPGALALQGEAARVPYPYFIDYPIFGVTKASELFDYFVNLGPLTPAQSK